MSKLPNFIIIGVQKGGTVALVKNLSKVESVYMANNNSIEGEPHFFDYKWDQGVEWYRSLFQTDKKFIGEKTPNYLTTYDAHSRIASLVPNAKLIVLLRNPTDRAYSAWNHFNQAIDLSKKWGWEISDFETAVFEKKTDINRRLLFNGHYVDHIAHLLKYFNLNQIHFTISERLKNNPREEFERILGFLGVPSQEIVLTNEHVRKYPARMLDSTRSKIDNYFQEYNIRLFDLLGEDIPEWSDKRLSHRGRPLKKPAPILFMISSGRSGTHAIRSIFAQLPGIKVLGEVFNHSLQRDIEGDFTRYFERWIKINPAWTFSEEFSEKIICRYFDYIQSITSGKSAVIDIKDEQLSFLDWPSKSLDAPPKILTSVLEKQMPILRMTRKNRLAQYLSMKIAQKTRKWIISKDSSENIENLSIYVHKEDLLEKITSYEKEEELVERWLGESDLFLRLYYEDCFDQGELTPHFKEAIRSHLGVDISDEIQTDTIKIVKDYRQHIINFDEMVTWLEETPLNRYLEMSGWVK
jgi:hypothetical protein